MANQISDFFRVQSEADAVAGTADHIAKFWDPRMRSQMTKHLAAGGHGLNAIARKAVEQVCQPAAAANANTHS